MNSQFLFSTHNCKEKKVFTKDFHDYSRKQTDTKKKTKRTVDFSEYEIMSGISRL